MNSPRVGVGLALALASLSSACNMVVACDMAINPAIVLTVRDAASGAPLSGATARATSWASDDAFIQDSIPGQLNLFAASGTYTVRVHRLGYQEWIQTGVTVEDYGGTCGGPITEPLEARLVGSAAASRSD